MKNTRIAKELIRVAKTIIASDMIDEPVFEIKIPIDSDKALEMLNMKDSEVREIKEMEREASMKRLRTLTAAKGGFLVPKRDPKTHERVMGNGQLLEHDSTQKFHRDYMESLMRDGIIPSNPIDWNNKKYLRPDINGVAGTYPEIITDKKNGLDYSVTEEAISNFLYENEHRKDFANYKLSAVVNFLKNTNFPDSIVVDHRGFASYEVTARLSDDAALAMLRNLRPSDFISSTTDGNPICDIYGVDDVPIMLTLYESNDDGTVKRDKDGNPTIKQITEEEYKKEYKIPTKWQIYIKFGMLMSGSIGSKPADKKPKFYICSFHVAQGDIDDSRVEANAFLHRKHLLNKIQEFKKNNGGASPTLEQEEELYIQVRKEQEDKEKVEREEEKAKQEEREREKQERKQERDKMLPERQKCFDDITNIKNLIEEAKEEKDNEKLNARKLTESELNKKFEVLTDWEENWAEIMSLSDYLKESNINTDEYSRYFITDKERRQIEKRRNKKEKM